jgi:hypothetical protein
VPLLAIGIWRRRQPWGAAALVAAVAATALLAPALALPDGVPSQAGLLGALAPWRGEAPAAVANPHLLDVTHQVEPWLLFLRRELRAGRLPFWDPHQFSGEPFWSNGSSAPLFPLHLLFAALPVQLGLLLLPWLRVAIGGCGAAALARQLGVGGRAAAVAAVVYALSGTVVSFLLFPMGNTHALMPWVLRAVERIAAGSGSWLALATLGGLQLLGGHPETPLFTALLASVWLLARGANTRSTDGAGAAAPSPSHAADGGMAQRLLAARRLVDWRAWGLFFVGWSVAAAISAVQIVPLMLTAFESSKWLHWQPPMPIPWGTRGTLLLRAVLPHPFGSATDGSWWGPYNDPATAIYAGALVLPLAVVALPLVRRDRRWRAVLVFTVAALLGAYHFPLVKQLLLALPLLRHGLHHYLKIGLELGLALFAAAGWQRWLDGEARRALRLGAILHLLLIAVTVAVFLPGWRAHAQLSAQLPWVAFAAASALALLASTVVPATARARLAWVAPALLLADLGLAHRAVNPGVSVAALYPRTPAVAFLQSRPGRVAGTGATLRPDAAMVYGVDDVRGDSPLKVERYQRLYRQVAAPDPVYFRPIERWRDPLLDELGLRWVMTPPGEAAADPRWRLAFDGGDGRVWERPSALPLVRWEQSGDAPPRVVERAAGRWRIAWRSGRSQRLVVAETWDGGWQARVSGRRLAVHSWRGALMAVDLPAGEGTVELRYRPRGLLPGLVVSLLAVGGCTLAALRRRRH